MAESNELRKAVHSVKSIFELRDALNAYKPELDGQRLEDAVDLTDLPTFDGIAPCDTSEVWSWDAENVMLLDGENFHVVRRDSASWYDRETGKGVI